MMASAAWLTQAAQGFAAAAAPPGGFEPTCASDEDFGWPRFQSLPELQADAAWSKYFSAAYGELPSAFPVCVYDFWALDKDAYLEAGLNGTRKIVNRLAVQEGDLFDQVTLGFEGLGIYHGRWAAAPNNSWVEVAHAVLPTEWTGAWVWRLPGSGVWVNVGRTKVFPTPSDPSKIHMEAITWLVANCSKQISPDWPLMESDIFGFCAREKGLDSIQFEPQAGEVPLGTFTAVGLTEIVIVSLDGNRSCGVPEPTPTPLRVGWRASRTCDCEPEVIPPTCGLMPFQPASLPNPAYPALCEAQAENHSSPCNPLACHSWEDACKPKSRPRAKGEHAVASARQSRRSDVIEWLFRLIGGVL